MEGNPSSPLRQSNCRPKDRFLFLLGVWGEPAEVSTHERLGVCPTQPGESAGPAGRALGVGAGLVTH